jgi:hypothetical protein
MTMPNDEAQMIHEHLAGARQTLELLQKQKSDILYKIATAQRHVEEAKQAAIDYMQGNGLVSDDYFRIGKSEAVIVDDVDALPDDFVRIKREADKAKIKALRPNANWYRIEESITLTLKQGE